MIEIKNLTKIFYPSKKREVVALENIDLTISKGEMVLLKGASGSGKSTILSLIASLSKPSYGEVLVNGEQISKYPDDFAAEFRQEEIGFIFQKFNLVQSLSVQDNIVIPLIPKNLDSNEVTKKLEKAMKSFNIAHKKDEIVKNLSGGEQQRVAIARSMINDPEIILADEPTANLDAKLSNEFLIALEELKKQNKTIIIATHDPIFDTFDAIDRVIEVKNGKIV